MNKLFIVISAQRHSSTFFLSEIEKTFVNFVIKFELFNFNQFPENININPIKVIEKYLDYKNFGFKIFYQHLREQQIKDIIKHFKDRLLIIFLRRPLEDSYKSLCKSLITGNWGTTPEKQLQWVKDNTVGYKYLPPNFHEYKNNINNWFLFVSDICLKYNINTINVNFDDVINQESLNKIKIEILNKLNIIV